MLCVDCLRVYTCDFKHQRGMSHFKMRMLSNLDVWKHLILIRVLYSFIVYTLQTQHMIIVITCLQRTLPFSADKVKFLLRIYALYISAS